MYAVSDGTEVWLSYIVRRLLGYSSSTVRYVDGGKPAFSSRVLLHFFFFFAYFTAVQCDITTYVYSILFDYVGHRTSDLCPTPWAEAEAQERRPARRKRSLLIHTVATVELYGTTDSPSLAENKTVFGTTNTSVE